MFPNQTLWYVSFYNTNVELSDQTHSNNSFTCVISIFKRIMVGFENKSFIQKFIYGASICNFNDLTWTYYFFRNHCKTFLRLNTLHTPWLPNNLFALTPHHASIARSPQSSSILLFRPILRYPMLSLWAYMLPQPSSFHYLLILGHRKLVCRFHMI